MIRSILCLLLAATLCFPAEPPAIKAARMVTGRVVVVTLISGEVVKGRLQGVTPASVAVMTATSDTATTREIPVGEIKFIRQPGDGVRDGFAFLGGMMLVIATVAVILSTALGAGR